MMPSDFSQISGTWNSEIFTSSHATEDLMKQQDLKACYLIEENFNTNYKMLNTLGKGNFSVVKRAFHVPTCTTVAVKILQNNKYTSVTSREARIMKSLSHPNIIKLYHVVETRETTYLVMEYASEGELQDRIIQAGSLEDSEARKIFVQIVHAVQYCHDHHIAHRDIKASNILINHKGNIKLGDFGLATKVVPGQKLAGFCGTLPYCAPELLQAEKYEGLPVDIWSLGVLLFLMVSGSLPFRGNSFVEIKWQIISANFRVPPHVSIDIFNVIVEMLMINPSRRPTIHQIKTRPMIRDSEACLPPNSTQVFPDTRSPSTVRSTRAVTDKPDRNISSCSSQEEFKSVTLTGSSSGDTLEKETVRNTL
ncbi:sperm motility kinase X-like [Rattus norvegicus]|uniref:non-specific serine/threonine protein kinase n=1 Tax=Rattus norvegicus TaxID=10116 RepID=A0A8I6GDY5_RAT|nr:sperm motility kinase X-like [Rattus norvegicus]|eukprot:XP_002728730.1 PREDICTED: sperm motility kinase X-like [Rattus norvegicus]